MPSVKGEGIHRVIFVTVLSCGCTVLYHVAARVDDLVYCARHETGSKVSEVTRRYLLQDAS